MLGKMCVPSLQSLHTVCRAMAVGQVFLPGTLTILSNLSRYLSMACGRQQAQFTSNELKIICLFYCTTHCPANTGGQKKNRQYY